MDEYLNKLDWRVNANSNQGYSLGGMILNTSGKTESGPPKNLTSAVSQMVNFLGTLQNEWAGAQAFSSFDTYLSPFVKKYSLKLEKEITSLYKNLHPEISDEKSQEEFQEKINTYVDKKTYEYVHQNIQSFVFNLNVPSRWGTQTPFTNITLDWVCPDDLKEKKLVLGGTDFEYPFKDLQKEMDMINKAYIEVMTKGDEKGRVFTFPIPTYNIVPDFPWESENTELLFEMTAKYGMPYFQF
jgi:ribonucleoside-triphosphate reductase